MDEKLIFISCGQQTDEEKGLGKSVKDLVDSTAGFAGYFAEYVQSLEGLTDHIFDALRTCSGFIAFLHDRGRIIEKTGAEWTRTSVWVNQELAILAYRGFAETISIPVLLLKDSSVRLEGAMTSLIANPVAIGSRQEVLEKVRAWLSSREFPAPAGVLDDVFNGLWGQLSDNSKKVMRALIKLGGRMVSEYTIQTRLTQLYALDQNAAAEAVRGARQDFSRTSLADLDITSHSGKKMSVNPAWKWHIARALEREGIQPV
jgi:hypothetical protein